MSVPERQECEGQLRIPGTEHLVPETTPTRTVVVREHTRRIGITDDEDRARTTDPETSKRAARRANEGASKAKSVALIVSFAKLAGVNGFTDDDLVDVLHTDRNIAARRRLTAERKGLIVRTKRTRLNDRRQQVMVFLHQDFIESYLMGVKSDGGAKH